MALSCKTIVTSFALLAMTGCTIIPGSHFEGIESGEQVDNVEKELEKVNIQIIDSSLINQQKQSQVKNFTPSSLDGIDTSNYQYKLGVGDVLSIGVWDHPELTIPAAVQRTAEFDGFRVQADGTITYAYAPNIQAAGKTVQQVHAELVKRLSRVIEEPQVDVKVVGFGSQKYSNFVKDLYRRKWLQNQGGLLLRGGVVARNSSDKTLFWKTDLTT